MLVKKLHNLTKKRHFREGPGRGRGRGAGAQRQVKGVGMFTSFFLSNLRWQHVSAVLEATRSRTFRSVRRQHVENTSFCAPPSWLEEECLSCFCYILCRGDITNTHGAIEQGRNCCPPGLLKGQRQTLLPPPGIRYVSFQHKRPWALRAPYIVLRCTAASGAAGKATTWMYGMDELDLSL